MAWNIKWVTVDYTGESSQEEVLVKANFHRSWYLVERGSLLWKRWSPYLLMFQKEKFYCNKFYCKTVPGLVWTLEIFVVNVITLITLYMNPWPINITLGCRIFVTDFYMANFAGVDYIINIFGDYEINTLMLTQKMFR